MTAAGPAAHGARPSSIAELKAVAQPPEVRGRRNAEHWTASLYLRNLSPYLTWFLLKTSISANGVTGLMILTGWATAASLLIPGIGGAAIVSGTLASSVIFGAINQVVSFGSTPVIGEIAMLALAIILLRLMPQGITGRFFRNST